MPDGIKQGENMTDEPRRGRAYVDPYGDPRSPFSPLGKTARPLAERKRFDRVPVAVGPIQKALSIASGKYSYYREKYEEEKDRGHFPTELGKRTKLYGDLSRDLGILLKLLRSETQNVFMEGIGKQQKAKRVRKSGMLDRAVKMVVG